MGQRDHAPLVIEDFNGLWKRGEPDEAPLDHFTDCNNVELIPGGVKVRDGIEAYQDALTKIGPVSRVYNYVLQTGDTLLALGENGKIYHIISPTVIYGPILAIATMTDFGFVPFAGRAYITPFNSTTLPSGDTNEIGLQNEFLYVYKGDGTAARKAAGPPPIATAITAVAGGGTYNDLGLHIFAVVYETDTGYLTAPGPLDNLIDKNPLFATVDQVAENAGYSIGNIPVSSNAYVTKRHIVATRAINPDQYNGDLDGYQFYFVPDGEINDNTTTSKIVNFFDIDLLEDASHLIDNFSEIPAGVGLTSYNGRLVLTTMYTDISLVRVSAPGEPEAIDQVDGLIIIPLDGTPVTNVQEFRDALYVFKKSGTWAVIDNGDEPTTWTPVTIDSGIGCPVHGIATILDSGGVNTDYLAIVSYAGIFTFNGTYFRPEASYKIQTLWLDLNRNHFRKMQLINNTIKQTVLILLPEGNILTGDYSEALSPTAIKWSLWTFKYKITSICMTEIDTLILATERVLYP